MMEKGTDIPVVQAVVVVVYVCPNVKNSKQAEELFIQLRVVDILVPSREYQVSKSTDDTILHIITCSMWYLIA